MRLSAIALFLFCSDILSAQTTYKCTYADTITVRIPADMSFNFGGNLPDSIQKKLSSVMSKHLSVKPLVQRYERKVSAAADTTVIDLEAGDALGGINMNQPYHRMVMSGGKILSVYDADGNRKPLPEEEAPRFIATGRKQRILDYECEAYKSDTITIWVTAALPAVINPGIKNGGVPGAILAFENEGENITMVSKVQSIQKFSDQH